jgi:hypothetical protein
MSEDERKRVTRALSTMEIVPFLPARLPSHFGKPFPPDLAGATVLNIGTLPQPDGSDLVEGGGLVIDYRASGSEAVYRVIFEFSEEGMWLRFQGFLDAPA